MISRPVSLRAVIPITTLLFHSSANSALCGDTQYKYADRENGVGPVRSVIFARVSLLPSAVSRASMQALVFVATEPDNHPRTQPLMLKLTAHSGAVSNLTQHVINSRSLMNIHGAPLIRWLSSQPAAAKKLAPHQSFQRGERLGDGGQARPSDLLRLRDPKTLCQGWLSG